MSRLARYRSFPLLIIGWYVLRDLQLEAAAGGFGSDVGTYFEYARAWAAGGAPYADFQLEYPPGALLLFAAPLRAGGTDHYVRHFVLEMRAFDLIALVFVFLWAVRLAPAKPLHPWAAAAAYLCATTALYPVLYSRFDLAPAALTLAALYLAYTPAAAAGALLLGLAGAIKLWPLALAPLFVALAARRAGRRGAFLAAASLLAGLLLPVLPFLRAGAGSGLAAFLAYHQARGLQLESGWASLLELGEILGLGHLRRVDEYGAYHLQCGPCGALAAVSGPALLLLALAPQALAWWRGLGTAADRGALGLRAAAAAVLGALVASKVLSPQFILWGVPLAVAGGGVADALAMLLVALLTTLVYPFYYPELLDARVPGHALAVLALAARNLLLGAVATRMLWRIFRSPPAPIDNDPVP